jgi:hypothetical protein
MPDHSPVPAEACRGPRVDDQRRTVPTSRRGANLSAVGLHGAHTVPDSVVSKRERLRSDMADPTVFDAAPAAEEVNGTSCQTLTESAFRTWST